MPSGSMPTYEYRPAPSTSQPFLKTRSSIRARLFEGGTYFRAREPGGPGNRLSVEVIEFIPPGDNDYDGACVVQNDNVVFSENVTGECKVELLDLKLSHQEWVEIDQLHTDRPRARHHSISVQIGATPGPVVDLGRFYFSKLFHIPGLLSAKLTPGKAVYAPTDKIVIKPRFTVHRLARVQTAPEPPLLPEWVWDINDLRAKVNADCPWVEMMPRSGADPITGPVTPKFDEQDDGIDADGLTPFARAYLKGGDGLPETPTGEVTGPSRSIVHVNYGENYNGSLSEVNTVYEWVGSTAKNGSWVAY